MTSDRDALLALVDSATALMERHSIKRAGIDWAVLRETARAYVRRAPVPGASDAHGAILEALRILDDGHSFLLPAEATQRLSESRAADNQPTEVRLLRPGVGYAKIPGYLGGNSVEQATYAAQTQARIRALSSPEPCAWVIDLRGNWGGNMFPMLAGIGPILGNGLAGFFVSADDAVSPWGYTDGAAWEGQDTLVRVTDPVRYSAPPAVAVLTDSLTASSGEAIAISFRGRAQTRSFGAPTAGLTTGNEDYELPDGSTLILATVIEADRTGRRYDSRLDPDQSTLDTLTLDAGLAWLQRTAACF